MSSSKKWFYSRVTMGTSTIFIIEFCNARYARHSRRPIQGVKTTVVREKCSVEELILLGVLGELCSRKKRKNRRANLPPFATFFSDLEVWVA
jgi:hypothetical protein